MTQTTSSDNTNNINSFLKGLYHRNKQLIIISTAIYFLGVFVGLLIGYFYPVGVMHFLITLVQSDKQMLNQNGLTTQFILLHNFTSLIFTYIGGLVGVITVFDLVQKFADLVAVTEPGGVIVLELNSIDYSLSQIAQIVEGNDAKILSFYISQESDSKLMTVTLKINVIDLSAIIQTFVRYDYDIKAVYMDDSIIQNLYDDRLDQLMKFMNI